MVQTRKRAAAPSSKTNSQRSTTSLTVTSQSEAPAGSVSSVTSSMTRDGNTVVSDSLVVSDSRLLTGHETRVDSFADFTSQTGDSAASLLTSLASASMVMSTQEAESARHTDSDAKARSPAKHEVTRSLLSSLPAGSSVSPKTVVVKGISAAVSPVITTPSSATSSTATVTSGLTGAGAKYIVINPPPVVQTQGTPSSIASTQAPVIRYRLVLSDKTSVAPTSTSAPGVVTIPVLRGNSLLRDSPAPTTVTADASLVTVSQQTTQQAVQVQGSTVSTFTPALFLTQPATAVTEASASTTHTVLAASLSDHRPTSQQQLPCKTPLPIVTVSSEPARPKATSMIEIPSTANLEVTAAGGATFVDNPVVAIDAAAMTHSLSALEDAAQTVLAVEDEESEGHVTWSKEATLKLIELYKEHQVYLNDHHYKKKSVWEIIANRLRKETSEHYRWNQVENKWKNITKKYRDCVRNNRRFGSNYRCRFYNEIAAVYSYNPDDHDQAQKTAAEGLRALSSSARPQSKAVVASDKGAGSASASFTFGITGAQPNLLVKTKHERLSLDDDSLTNGAGDGDGIPLLTKKKKYARLEAAGVAHQIPTASATSSTSVSTAAMASTSSSKASGSDDILTVLKELREDRARQEKVRMDRLETMHKEKMQLFGQFLDLLKPPEQT